MNNNEFNNIYEIIQMVDENDLESVKAKHFRLTNLIAAAHYIAGGCLCDDKDRPFLDGLHEKMMTTPEDPHLDVLKLFGIEASWEMTKLEFVKTLTQEQLDEIRRHTVDMESAHVLNQMLLVKLRIIGARDIDIAAIYPTKGKK